MPLGTQYNNGEYGPPGARGPIAMPPEPEPAEPKKEERHPQDKVLEYLKDGQPAEDEFCTENSSIKNLDNYFIGKRIG